MIIPSSLLLWGTAAFLWLLMAEQVVGAENADPETFVACVVGGLAGEGPRGLNSFCLPSSDAALGSSCRCSGAPFRGKILEIRIIVAHGKGEDEQSFCAIKHLNSIDECSKYYVLPPLRDKIARRCTCDPHDQDVDGYITSLFYYPDHDQASNDPSLGIAHISPLSDAEFLRRLKECCMKQE